MQGCALQLGLPAKVVLLVGCFSGDIRGGGRLNNLFFFSFFLSPSRGCCVRDGRGFLSADYGPCREGKCNKGGALLLAGKAKVVVKGPGLGLGLDSEETCRVL